MKKLLYGLSAVLILSGVCSMAAPFLLPPVSCLFPWEGGVETRRFLSDYAASAPGFARSLGTLREASTGILDSRSSEVLKQMEQAASGTNLLASALDLRSLIHSSLPPVLTSVEVLGDGAAVRALADLRGELCGMNTILERLYSISAGNQVSRIVLGLTLLLLGLHVLRRLRRRNFA